MRVRSPVDASVGCGRQGVGIGGPDIEGRDLVAVASDEPTKGCDPGFNGKRRIRLGEVAGRPSQRLRIAGVALARATASSNSFASSPDANYYGLLLVALLERGAPLTLEQAAVRFEEAGVAPAPEALASLKLFVLSTVAGS